jgi:hypothetical protein
MKHNVSNGELVTSTMDHQWSYGNGMGQIGCIEVDNIEGLI